jgi:endoglycosylceramidase
MRARLGGVVAALAAGIVAAPAHAALPRLHAVPDRDGRGRIVDAAGRQVVLRGVNVNALARYWKGTRFRTVFPLERRDPRRLRALGFDAVRLVVSWSRVEPAPGRYDAAYLRRVRRTARRLTREGIYVIVDLHQDAWSATLAARPGETCPAGSDRALGWDGAPAWATLVPASVPRCAPGGIREASPAVRRAWTAFWADAPGPGGVGIQRRYVRMLGHVARVLAREPGIAGYDVMNEPNAFGGAEEAAMSRMYARAVRAIRAGEHRGHGRRRMILFEPSAVWSETGSGPPPPFEADRDVVYAPHIYSDPIDAEAFRIALREARGLGGVPVLTGEWGAGRGSTGYMRAHLDLQDRFGLSSTQWTWRESCGDPHQRGTALAGTVSTSTFALWGIDCATNRILPIGRPLRTTVARGYVRAAPGRLAAMRWDAARGILRARGRGARAGTVLEAFYPRAACQAAIGRGLRDLRIERAPGGARITARAAGGPWRLRLHRLGHAG